MATTKELREQRAKLVETARAIEKAADAEGRAMTQEELTNWDKAMEDGEALKATYERMERSADAEKELEESRGRVTEPRSEREPAPNRMVKAGAISARERADALRAWMLRGTNTMPSEALVQTAQKAGVVLDERLMPFNLAQNPPKSTLRDDLREWLEDVREERAQTLTTTAGGYVVPDDVMQALEVAMLAYGGMRTVSDVLRTSTGADLPWPTVNDTSQKGEILAINTEVNQQDLVFGQLVLNAYKYSSKMILVPVELLQDAAINVPQVIGEALGTRIARITNEHFTTGTGTNQPNGIVTASTLGVTAASTTAITADEFVDLEHSVDPAYRRNARWMFSDAVLKAAKQLKDSENRHLWLPGLAVKEPDTLLGYPYEINQDMATPAADAVTALFGDLSKYKIRDVQEVILRRLDERFADFHQVAFLAFSRHDGDLLDAGTNPVKHLVQDDGV